MTTTSLDQPTEQTATPDGVATPSRSQHVRRLAATLAAAGIACLVSTAVPLLGPLLVALFLGVLGANTPGLGRYVVGQSPALDRWLLRAGIVLLGLKVVFADIVDLGVAGIVVVLATVVTTFTVTLGLGRLLGVPKELTTLVAAGFSICGAAAVAAVESSIGAKAKDVALAVALVTVFGSAMIVIVPTAGHLLGLRPEQTAVWAGASIHEVAQVIAAASLVSSAGVVIATAMTVKLARVALLAPVQVIAARHCSTPGVRRGPLVPTFLVLFLLAVAIRSTGQVPDGVLTAAGTATTVLLAAAMFGLGTTVVARQLWPIPGRVLVLAGGSTVVAASVSLALVAALV